MNNDGKKAPKKGMNLVWEIIYIIIVLVITNFLSMKFFSDSHLSKLIIALALFAISYPIYRFMDRKIDADKKK